MVVIMRHALIKNNVVYSIIECSEEHAQLVGAIASETAQVSDIWNNGGFSRVNHNGTTEVPKSVTRRQARQALFLAGKLDLVQTAIDAIPNATQKALINIEWNDSLEFERNRPSLIAIGTAIGLNSTQLDELFITASTL
jgi:hypothetical protein